MSQNSLSQQLNNLSLTFYSFQIRNSINEGETTVPEANQLWEQLTKLGHILNIPQLKTLKSQLICYQNNQYQPQLEDRQTQEYFSLLHHQAEGLDFTIPALKALKINCFLCPYRLHDTYAIDITLSPENPLQPSQLKALNLSSHLQPALGQSLLLYAEPKVPLGDYPPLANTCINKLFSQNNSLGLKAKSKILNCPIFAYDNEETDPTKQCHIILWFNPHLSPPEQIDQANEYLLYLLWSRHKILYAYHQSRYCNDQAKQLYSDIEQEINKFRKIAQLEQQERLEEFKELLIQLPEQSVNYKHYLRDLEDHKNTIQANLKNSYKFIEKLEKLPDCDLRFLQQFLDFAVDKLQTQIETDLSFLRSGEQLFQEVINNIRGIVAIDQIESDRSFQLKLQNREQQFQQALQQQKQQWTKQLRQQDEKSQRREKTLELWIAFFGTGLAVSGISAGVISEPGQKIITNLSLNPPSFCISNELVKFFCSNSFDILFHLMVGIVFAILGAIIMYLIQKFIEFIKRDNRTQE